MQSKVQIARVVVNGLTPIMFDRYAGDNQTDLPVERKMYFAEDGKILVLPSANVMSFFSAINTTSAPRRIYGKKAKPIAEGMLSYTTIDPFEIPFHRNGKPVVFGGFDASGYDSKNKIRISTAVARLPKGIPNPKVRPVLELPWSLEFTLKMFPNDDVNMEIAEKLLRVGGIALGFGTFRGVFGKFEVETFKVTDAK